MKGVKRGRNDGFTFIKQTELAAELGIARETIGKLERGDNQNPCYRLVYEVATYFGKQVEEIFQYEDADE